MTACRVLLVMTAVSCWDIYNSDQGAEDDDQLITHFCAKAMEEEVREKC